MAIRLWELRIDLSFKDAACATEGITRSSVNYLHKKNTNSHREMNENTFVDIVFIHFNLFNLLLFSSVCIYFKQFWIIRCIMKPLIASSMYFYWNTTEKKKAWKLFFGCQSFGAQTGIPVIQTAWICQCQHINWWNWSILNPGTTITIRYCHC